MQKFLKRSFIIKELYSDKIMYKLKRIYNTKISIVIYITYLCYQNFHYVNL